MSAGRCLLMVAAGMFVSVLNAGAEGFPYDHMHLTADDVDAAVGWYVKHLDGKEIGQAGRLEVGGTLFIFFKKDAGFPPSEGSSVDHFGIT